MRPAEILENRARRARAQPGLLGPRLALLVGRLALVADVDRRRRALEDVELLGDLGQLGDRLHGRRARADDADRLALQLDVVVPARRVERLALVRLHPVDAGQLGRRQDAVRQDDEAGLHRIAAIGGHRPAARLLVPHRRLHRRVEQAVLVERELLGHRLAVLEDLEARRELHRRDVAHLLEQREVAVGLDVAGDARVPVPVPRAADVAALLAEADVVEPGLAELVPQQQAGEPGADDEHVALVRQRLTRHRVGRVDVLQVLGELALHRHVVGGAAAGLLVLAVLLLLLDAERRPGRVRRQRLQLDVVGDPVARARDPVRRLGGAGVERLAARHGVGADGGLLAHWCSSQAGDVQAGAVMTPARAPST